MPKIKYWGSLSQKKISSVVLRLIAIFVLSTLVACAPRTNRFEEEGNIRSTNNTPTQTEETSVNSIWNNSGESVNNQWVDQQRQGIVSTTGKTEATDAQDRSPQAFHSVQSDRMSRLASAPVIDARAASVEIQSKSSSLQANLFSVFSDYYLSEGYSRSETIHNSSDEDWYEIDVLPGRGKIIISLDFDHSDADLDLYLYNRYGTLLDSSRGVSDYETISYEVAGSGDYYIKVEPHGSINTLFGARYSIRWDEYFGGGDDAYEGNDRSRDAYDLERFENRWLSGIAGIGVQFDEDWYQILVPGSGPQQLMVDLRHYHSEGDVELELYDGDGNLIAHSRSSSNDEFIEVTALPKVYHIRVYSSGSYRGTEYDMKWYTRNTTSTNTTDIRLNSLIFDWQYYLSQNQDLGQAGITTESAAATHWLAAGFNEGRDGSPSFHASSYLARYADLQSAFSGSFELAAQHYVNTGALEGRNASKSGSTTGGSTPTSPTGNILLSSSVFDWNYYVSVHADLPAAGIDTEAEAQTHWLNNGIQEGRRGIASFSAATYLSRYADLRAVFGNDNQRAIEHYVTFGIQEGRSGN